MVTTSRQTPINTNYEIFILGVSLLSIFNLIFEVLPIDQQVQNLLYVVDIAITPIFMIDFLFRLFSAPSKGGYFFKGGAGWTLSAVYLSPNCVLRACIVFGASQEG